MHLNILFFLLSRASHGQPPQRQLTSTIIRQSTDTSRIIRLYSPSNTENTLPFTIGEISSVRNIRQSIRTTPSTHITYNIRQSIRTTPSTHKTYNIQLFMYFRRFVFFEEFLHCRFARNCIPIKNREKKVMENEN